MSYRKYGNDPTIVNGIKFSSHLEAERYQQLMLLERAGEISGLQLQVEFQIFKGYINPDTGEKTKSVVYVADFLYIDNGDNRMIVEDTKGMETPDFRLKWKLVQSQYPGFTFRKVTRSDV